MISIIHTDNKAKQSPTVIDLNITQYSPYQKFTWSYTSGSQLFLPTGVSTITINLSLTNFSPGISATVESYASTGISALALIESEMVSGRPSPSPILKFKSSQDGVPATISLLLFPHQIIDFGLFVRVMLENKELDYLFCDPQASNDPQLSGTG
jgi:hypothetical protein